MKRIVLAMAWAQRCVRPAAPGTPVMRPVPARRAPSQWLGMLLVALAGLAAVPASAQTYPDRGQVIKIIVPSGPGSALDLLARAYSKAMGDVAGVSSIVENKPGGDGVIGIRSFLSLPTDGYSMLLVSNSWMSINPVMTPNLPYDPLKDLIPISTLSKAGIVLNMSGSLPYKTLREFVVAAKASPGKFTCASASPNLRMACEFFQVTAGIKLLIVPYKTTAAAFLAVGSGETDIVFADAGSALSHWASGRVKGMAVATAERSPSLPDMPTTREQGMHDFLMSAWYGLYFKAGTNPQMVATMREILRKAGETQLVKDSLKAFVHEPLHIVGDDVTAMNRKELETWTKLVRDHGIKFSN